MDFVPKMQFVKTNIPKQQIVSFNSKGNITPTE